MNFMQMVPNKLYLAMNTALFIAYNGAQDTPVSGSEIVTYCRLNKRALEPVLQRLSAVGLVVSLKGAKGGYYMPRPHETTLRDIVEAFRVQAFSSKHDFSGYTDILNAVLTNSYAMWLDRLGDVSFETLCRQARQTGDIVPIRDAVLNYAI